MTGTNLGNHNLSSDQQATEVLSDTRISVGATSGLSIATVRDTLFVIALTVGFLLAGRSLLVPMSIAVLTLVLLTAIADWIAGISIAGVACTRWLANLLSTVLVLTGLAAISVVIGRQTGDLSNAFPRYEARLDTIISGGFEIVGDRAAGAVRSYLETFNVSQLAIGVLRQTTSVVSTMFTVAVFVPFMMIERAPFFSKLSIAIRDDRQTRLVRTVILDISKGLQRYIGVKSAVSVLIGVCSYGVMKLLGLDFAETWGILTFALNFIPMIGSVLAVTLPALVALVQFDSLGPFFILILSLAVFQFVIGYVVEPALTGRSLNLSPFLVLLALTFWGTVWGIPGAFLSIPITVSLMIVLAQFPGTRAIAVMMSADGQLGKN